MGRKVSAGLLPGTPIYQPPVALTSSSANIAWNTQAAQEAVHTLAENTTITATGMRAGQIYNLDVVQISPAKSLAFGSEFRRVEDLPTTALFLGLAAGTVVSMRFRGSPDATKMMLLDCQVDAAG